MEDTLLEDHSNTIDQEVFYGRIEEPNALVTVFNEGVKEPNTRATLIELLMDSRL